MTTRREIFEQLLTDTNQRQGWDIPRVIVGFQAAILADHVDRADWQPKPSYAERYLQIRTAEQALMFANTCWFTRAVFPELGERRGIHSDYYVQLGQSMYREAGTGYTTAIMSRHFEFLAECAHTAVRHAGGWRSMWQD